MLISQNSFTMIVLVFFFIYLSLLENLINGNIHLLSNFITRELKHIVPKYYFKNYDQDKYISVLEGVVTGLYITEKSVDKNGMIYLRKCSA